MLIPSYWKVIIEIGVLWYFIYMVLIFVKGSRTEQLLKGLTIIIIIFIITQQLHLAAINWVLTRLFPISVIALLIIFQPELRRGLARLGQFGLYQEDIQTIEEISKAADALSGKRTGALVVLEREVGLKTYIETGVGIDSKVTEELIVSLFMSKGPLHDGAIIIQRDRLVAAGCLLPLTQEQKGLSKSLGTRHRAAIGLSEETDSICIVVSEETGMISMASSGKLHSNLSRESLSSQLKGIFSKKGSGRKLHLKTLAAISPKVTLKG